MNDPETLTNHEPPPLEHHPNSSTLDETIERCIGNFGWKQYIQASLVSFSFAFDAQQAFITIFTDSDPISHCNPSNDIIATGYNKLSTTTNNLFPVPKDIHGGVSWPWDFPPYTSTISEWSLQCAGSFLIGLPASSFFAGCLAGGLLLATLADSSLGRKKLLVLTCLLMSLSGILTAASTNIWIYSALRFLSGFFRATIGTSALVLATELVGKRWRGQIGILGFFFFTFGFLSLPLLGYLNRGHSWRFLYIWTCFPTLFYSIILHLFVCESPRWLYLQGRTKEFFQTLKSIGSTPATMENLSIINFSQVAAEDKQNDTGKKGNVYFSTIKTLWVETWAFRRLTVVMAIGFGEGMVYYGMPLGLESLAFNLYLSVALNALSELPAALITFFLVGNLNRKSLVRGFSILSGICSLMICAIVIFNGENGDPWNKGLWIGLEVASFFSTCAAFNVLLIYALELFPTCVRNSALSMVRLSVVFGGVFGPLVVAAGRNNNGFYSFVVFGMTTVVTGLLVGCLPETNGTSICDTLEEEKLKEFRANSAAGGAKNINVNHIREAEEEERVGLIVLSNQ